MNDLNALVSLDYVVASIINMAEVDERRLVHIKQLVIEGYQELCIFHLSNMKVSYLSIEDNNIVTLPNDFLFYSKIGILINGRVHTLTLDDSIALPRALDCGEDTAISSTYNFSLSSDYNQPYNTSSYFGRSSVNVGKYRIDEERRVIQLSGMLGQSGIVLEYCTIPIKIGEDTMVKRYVVPSLRAYVMEKMVQYDTRVRDNEKERRHQDYIAEIYKLRTIEHGLTADEYMDIINATRQQVPKR